MKKKKGGGRGRGAVGKERRVGYFSWTIFLQVNNADKFINW